MFPNPENDLGAGGAATSIPTSDGATPAARTGNSVSDGAARAARMSFGREFAVHVLLPVIVGGTIYVLWRSPSLLLFKIARYSGNDLLVGSWRHATGDFVRVLPNWILFSLPDALWIYAFTFYLGAIWASGPRLHRICWTSVGPVIGIGGELGQRVGIVPGTFDWIDLAWCCAASAAAVLVLAKRGDA